MSKLKVATFKILSGNNLCDYLNRFLLKLERSQKFILCASTPKSQTAENVRVN